MYFYIDESGHTGNNLFDTAQPTLYYGLLSCKLNLDLLAEPYLTQARKMVKVKKIHTAELSINQLNSIAPLILQLQKKYYLVFDYYRVVKADHAVITFFDQVFDHGINPAITPLCQRQ